MEKVSNERKERMEEKERTSKKTCFYDSNSTLFQEVESNESEGEQKRVSS